ncbi:MAG: endopeptidase La [Candidatus Shapirobacteria bacterium]
MSSLPKIFPVASRLFPLVPLRNMVPFPGVDIHAIFGRSKSVSALNEAYKGDRLLALVAQKDAKVEDPKKRDLYEVGVVGKIEQIIKADKAIHALITGVKRVNIEEIIQQEPFEVARVNEINEPVEEPEKLRLVADYLARELKKAYSLGKTIDPIILMRLTAGLTPSQMADQVAYIAESPILEKQKILAVPSAKRRLEMATELISREIKVLQLERKIESKTQGKFEKGMRRSILEEKRRTIDKELEGLGVKKGKSETQELRKKIMKAKMSKEARKKALSELKRLSKMPSIAPEASYIQTYLDWLLEVPWNKKTPNNVSLNKASRILNEDHYGLKDAKERVLEYLAVMKLKKKRKDKENTSNILCFIGPPGVGKTSIGKSVARAMNRRFVRVSLGGIRDEAEIRGHRRTYVGAMPGRIIQGMKTAGTKNPIFMLDEIDKVGTDFRGDPSAALLEALDPEQNREFSDHYLEVPYDLSEVFFILTGNVLETIPPALKDRLEIIRFSGYTHDEKLQIAKKYLLPKQTRQNGLTPKQANITDKGLLEIIRFYTREAGVRELERMIANIGRKIAKKVAGNKKAPASIGPKEVKNLLGVAHYSDHMRERKNEKGVSTGLAWTQAGGDILFIEVALMPGAGKIYLTGKLGSVMKESCQAAVSYLRSNWKKLGIEKNFAKKLDVHIHVPEGAVSKDGPSAGVAIATALISALTEKKANCSMGMTGEITLRGKVLEIGGVKEKVLAAHRAELKTIILPKDNKKDLKEIPAKVKRGLKFIFVENLDQVFKAALV